MAVWGGLTNNCEKKRSEKQRQKNKYFLNIYFMILGKNNKAQKK